jgi:cell division protein FtsQ
MKPAGLLSPRGAGHAYDDVGDRPPLIARQRVRRAAALHRRRARPARAALIGLAAGVPLVLGGLLVHFGLTSDRFMVAAVEVGGTSRLSPAAIVAAAGIPPGTNLFLLDALAVSRRVEVLPEVRHAAVIRAWPNRVRIVVEERRPFTLVHAGRLHWVDEEGVALGVERRAVNPPSPVISGLTAEELGTMREHPSARAQAGITLIRLLLRKGSPLATEISEIDVSRADDPVLFTVDGVEVRLGADSWESRLGRLEGVLGQVAGSAEPVTSIDLRFRDQVVLNGGGAR